MKKKLLALFLALAMLMALAACGGTEKEDSTQQSTGDTGQNTGDTQQSTGGTEQNTEDTQQSTGDTEQNVELIVFAAASLTETMDQIIEDYKTVAPNVTIIPSYTSSGTLLTQIQEGAECDIFFSASPTQINTLDEEGGLLEGTRVDLLENKVALAVPDGNPKGIESFDQLAQLLEAGDVFLAMGNSDVPVGQYTQKIFDYYGLDEETLAGNGLLTYGTDVKEVTTQVTEATVDCGIIYATDAFSANLTTVDGATAEMCGQVIYPAAVLAASEHPDEATAFLDYLCTSAAGDVFASVGFTPLT